jgi:hypothetical protein
MIWKARDHSPASEEKPATAGSQAEDVVDAAERAAAGIREDAQAWARQYMEESRRRADEIAAQRLQEISALTDRLIARARAVAEQSDDLISALDDARRRLLSSESPEPEPKPPAESVLEPVPPIPEPERPIAPPAEPQLGPGGELDSGASEGARLLATQMAVAGSTRDEIAGRLREEFGIDDPSPILDEIGL